MLHLAARIAADCRNLQNIMIHVSPARADQYPTALELMFSRHPKEDRPAHVRDVLDACCRGEISLDGLLLAERDGVPVGVGLFIIQPDKTAFVWPPSIVDDRDSTAVTDAIFSELRSQVDKAGVWLSQCLVEIEETSERDALSRNEFAHLADLCYLQRLLSPALESAPDDRLASVEFRPEDEANIERFAKLIERTYVDTLDCPGLKGTRNGHEALASHMATGKFEPSRWKLYVADGRDVGLLLLNDHPDQDAWEVVYTGVAPEARGNGFGRSILIDGIQQAKRSGRRALMLAVDNCNTFAKEIYASVGFVEIARRAAHARIPPSRVR